MKKEKAEQILGIVRDNYEKISSDFNVSRKKEIWPEMKELATEVKDGERVLDLGCGNGRLLEALKDKKINYLGLDNSFKLITEAKKNYPGSIFEVGDILDLGKIPNGSYDHIFCLAVLQHIPSRELREATLKEMQRKLRPNGRLIISVWNLWSPVWKKKKYKSMIIKNWLANLFFGRGLDFGDIFFPWKNSRGEITSKRYYHAFTALELRWLAAKSQLKIEKLVVDDYNYWLTIK